VLLILFLLSSSLLCGADGRFSLPGFEEAPMQHNMHDGTGNTDFCCGDRGCCKVFYLCGDCLERHKDTFPVSCLVRYGRCCAKCPCNVSAEQRAAFLVYQAMNRDADEQTSGPLCIHLCSHDNCGDPRDYHCSGRVVKTHCAICAVDGAFIALIAALCAVHPL